MSTRKKNHWHTLSHNVVSRIHNHEQGSNSQTLVVICTDCTCRYKSNYHTINTTIVPFVFGVTISRIYFKLEGQRDFYYHSKIFGNYKLNVCYPEIGFEPYSHYFCRRFCKSPHCHHKKARTIKEYVCSLRIIICKRENKGNQWTCLCLFVCLFF